MGVVSSVRFEHPLPFRFLSLPPFHRLPKSVVHRVGDEEVGLGGPAQCLLGQPHLLFAQRSAVGGGGVLLVGAAVGNVGMTGDQRGPFRLLLSSANSLFESCHVVAIHFLHEPAVSLKTSLYVLGESKVGAAINGYLIVVVEADELVQAQVPGQGGGLMGETLHQVAVGDYGVGAVIHDGIARAVEDGPQKSLGDGHAHPCGETLPQGAGGGLDTPRGVVLRMAGRVAAPLSKTL